MGGGRSRWVGRKSLKRKKKKKKGKENWVGAGEKIKFQKNKTEIRSEKGQTKKVNLGWHRDRKEKRIPSVHHPARWCTVECWFCLAVIIMIRLVISVSDWSVIMIGLSGQLVVSPAQFYFMGGVAKTKSK